MVWQSTETLPHTYDRLETHGVPATANLLECANGLGGGRGLACRLTLDLHGSNRTWVYPENVAQFKGLPIGAPIAMLVDPRNVREAYTVVDVRARSNTGFGVVAGVGTFFAIVGAAGLALTGRFLLSQRRRRQLDGD